MKKQTTVYDTPFLSPILQFFASISFKLWGWKIGGDMPSVNKYVLIAAPHTSNWDFFFSIHIAFIRKMKLRWMGKDALFNHPLGFIMKWLGGIPVDRSKPNGMVGQAIGVFNEADRLVMMIPPEGTRSKVKRWKSGFYHIAHGANVPICLGYLDFKKKIGGFGPLFTPSGDFEADLPKIQEYYKDITGKIPQYF